MIIGVIENGEVRIYENVDEVLNEWKAYVSDVQSEVVVFYDDCGTWLEPVFNELPKNWFELGKRIELLGLQPNSCNAKWIDPINLALYEASTLHPNRYFSNLEELRARFPFSRKIP